MVDEALLGLHASGVSSAQKHEAKPSTFAKATADKDDFIHHFGFFAEKAKMVELHTTDPGSLSVFGAELKSDGVRQGV